MSLIYKINAPVTPEEFARLLRSSGLSERRPLEDDSCIAGMINNSNLLISAWQKDHLVGIARSMTDFHYACYLSDLAVDGNLQKQGIGKKLIEMTTSQLGERCKLILLAAPAANEYYRALGFDEHPRCWVLDQKS